MEVNPLFLFPRIPDGEFGEAPRNRPEPEPLTLNADTFVCDSGFSIPIWFPSFEATILLRRRDRDSAWIIDSGTSEAEGKSLLTEGLSGKELVRGMRCPFSTCGPTSLEACLGA